MKTITITCEECGKQVQRKPANAIRSKHHYCSIECVSIAFTKQAAATLPKERGTKPANCIDCNIQLYINRNHPGKSIRCKECKRLHRNKKQKKKCLDCSTAFIGGKRATYCPQCRTNRLCVSLTHASRRRASRSLNEVYFGELCSNYFPEANITMNEKFFAAPNEPNKPRWDADIIIHTLKVAILWNGIWHYKQIGKRQSLKQVQNRDKMKLASIVANGYTPFIIKDMGAHDKTFVQEQFKLFLEWLQSIL